MASITISSLGAVTNHVSYFADMMSSSVSYPITLTDGVSYELGIHVDSGNTYSAIYDAASSTIIINTTDSLSVTNPFLTFAVDGATATYNDGGESIVLNLEVTLTPTLLAVYNVNNGAIKRRILAVKNDIIQLGNIDVYNADTNAKVVEKVGYNPAFGSTTRDVIYYVLASDAASTVTNFYFKRTDGDYAQIASNTVTVESGIDNLNLGSNMTLNSLSGSGPYTLTFDVSQAGIDILNAEMPFNVTVSNNTTLSPIPVFETVTPVFSGSTFSFTTTISQISLFSVYNPVTYKSSPWRLPPANKPPTILNITETFNSIAVDVSYNTLIGQSVGNITVQLAKNSLFNSGLTSIKLTPGNSTANFTGLTSNTLYHVRAIADAGLLNAYTSPAQTKTTALFNGTPDNIVATAGNATITATWAPPTGLSSADITKYTVSISPAPSSGPSSYDVSGNVTSQLFNNLSNGTPYTVSVSAWNAASQGPVGTASATPAGGSVPCFFGNAPVLTTTGYRRMDSLRAGDRVMTPEGGEATVERVKVTQCTAGPLTNPFVIPKGRFGAERRVLISPNHKVVTPAGLVEAKDLGLEQEDREGALTYYNLELTGQANMVVGGVAVESLAPVRRMTMTMGQFKAALQQKYGACASNANVLANIQRTCRILADGRVEVPVLRRPVA